MAERITPLEANVQKNQAEMVESDGIQFVCAQHAPFLHF